MNHASLLCKYKSRESRVCVSYKFSFLWHVTPACIVSGFAGYTWHGLKSFFWRTTPPKVWYTRKWIKTQSQWNKPNKDSHRDAIEDSRGRNYHPLSLFDVNKLPFFCIASVLMRFCKSNRNQQQVPFMGLDVSMIIKVVIYAVIILLKSTLFV